MGDDVEKVYKDAGKNDSKTAIDKTIEIAGKKSESMLSRPCRFTNLRWHIASTLSLSSRNGPLTIKSMAQN